MRNLFISFLVMLIVPLTSNADHFNQNNIIAECSTDRSFSSSCYTYVAAYKDFLSWFIRASEEEQVRSLCILRVNTDRITERLASSSKTEGSYQVTDLILAELCN